MVFLVTPLKLLYLQKNPLKKTLYALGLKGVALIIGQSTPFLADIFGGDNKALNYYSFINLIVIFSTISNGTYSQMFSQKFQSNRNLSNNYWVGVIINWNMILVLSYILASLYLGQLKFLMLGLCGFSLSLSALYSEKLRISNRFINSIFFPELTRSILLMFAFILIMTTNFNIEFTITSAYVLILILILLKLPRISFNDLTLILPNWRILIYGILNYFLFFDIELFKEFYSISDSLIMARFQKMIALEVLFIEIWFLSNSHIFHKKTNVRIKKMDKIILMILSLIIAFTFGVLNVILFSGSILSSLVFFTSSIFVQIFYILFPGKLIFQLFGFSSQFLLILAASVSIYFLLILFRIPVQYLFFIWSLLITLLTYFSFLISNNESTSI